MRRFFATSAMIGVTLACTAYLKDKVTLPSVKPAITQAQNIAQSAQNTLETILSPTDPAAEFTPITQDGKYILAGSYIDPLSAKELANTLALEGYCASTMPMTRIENGASVEYTRVILPFTTNTERKNTEKFLEKYNIDKPNALEIKNGDEQFLPSLGSSVTRYSTLDTYLHKNGGKIERLPYHKEIKKAIKSAKANYDIVDDEKFMMLFYASVWVESGFNPHAVSKVGAAGLSQIYDRDNLRRMGFEGELDADKKSELISKAPQLFDVTWNLREGARRMASLVDIYAKTYGDPYDDEGRGWIAAASNWGVGNLTRKGMDNAPRETRNHMVKVGDAYASLKSVR